MTPITGWGMLFSPLPFLCHFWSCEVHAATGFSSFYSCKCFVGFATGIQSKLASKRKGGYKIPLCQQCRYNWNVKRPPLLCTKQASADKEGHFSKSCDSILPWNKSTVGHWLRKCHGGICLPEMSLLSWELLELNDDPCCQYFCKILQCTHSFLLLWKWAI